MRNPLFSFHPANLPGKQQRKRYGRAPYNRRVAGMLREARGKKVPANRPARSTGSGGDRSDLVSALVNLGYAPAVAKQAAAAARGESFDAQLRDALAKVKNPMSQKKKRKKKNPVPAGLARFMRKQRAKKLARKRAAKKAAAARVRNVRRKANPRKKAVRIRRRRRNPVKGAPRMVRPPFPMTSTQLKKYARTLARATGKRVVIKSK